MIMLDIGLFVFNGYMAYTAARSSQYPWAALAGVCALLSAKNLLPHLW